LGAPAFLPAKGHISRLRTFVLKGNCCHSVAITTDKDGHHGAEWGFAVGARSFSLRSSLASTNTVCVAVSASPTGPGARLRRLRRSSRLRSRATPMSIGETDGAELLVHHLDGRVLRHLRKYPYGGSLRQKKGTHAVRRWPPPPSFWSPS